MGIVYDCEHLYKLHTEINLGANISETSGRCITENFQKIGQMIVKIANKETMHMMEEIEFLHG